MHDGPPLPVSTRPLAGVRVLELARVLAGPWIGQTLADLGADVVKIERPGIGDDTRAWGPPFVEAADGGHLTSGYFQSTNRGKRSVAADFETEEGRAVVRRLAARADVLVENFKVGGLAKYGLDWPSLRAINPRLVYCSVTGFGQDGPYAPRAGYDFMIQGLAGIMSLTGEPVGEPVKTAVAFADVFTGLYGAIGVLAALQGRERTGEGCHVDMALLDSQIAVLGNQALYYLVSGQLPPRMGNEHTSIVPYQVFPASDGHIIVACGNDGQFARFAGVLGADWAAEPAYATNPDRVRNRAVLIPLITARITARPKAELLAALAAVNVPSGPINRLDEVFSDPQVLHRGLKVDLAEPRARGGTVPAVRSPFMIDGRPAVSDRAPPGIGDHTAEVLADPAWAEDTAGAG